ncbi:arginine N-succinyltransferase [Thalassotalea sp. HSM 43]|uniref:arginine N-succinyltransferase n=1 Tax=Thalassotalea sp. HSM 43 TaxID=2552945 RepID=UPI00108044F3|nr:arginine N-succinyltransferase [Thalassotalea sp. HSM 43]QBY03917.1 arginine N-succinyltransferase [Thalassotalea sp. HSM 43]
MIIIRPIRSSDYDALHQIAVESGHGFTSLPVNEGLLLNRINGANQSFHQETNFDGSESYLFVMEDSETGEVVGTSGIEAAVGLHDAFYHYHVGKVVHSSRELNIYNNVEILALNNDYTGTTELCTLFLRNDYRANNNGRFLSKFRFLFMAEHKARFNNTVIAEMRGVSDENGDSPFWQWLEEHFFSMDFPTADYLTGIGKKSFIAELMPKYPIYVNLLSKEAQQVIGKVHEDTVPALRLLNSEGFVSRGYVDIFDAGPTVECELENIKTVRNSAQYQVAIGDVIDGERRMIINQDVRDFRAVYQSININKDTRIATMTADAAKALQIEAGDTVRLAKA